MDAEKVKNELVTAANAVYWGARRITPWVERLDGAQKGVVYIHARFDFEGVEIPLMVAVFESGDDPLQLRVVLGSLSAVFVPYTAYPSGLTAAALYLAIVEATKDIGKGFSAMKRVYSGQSVFKSGFFFGDEFSEQFVSGPAGRCQMIPYAADPDESKQRACTDCRHFQYLRMDPYCNLHGCATEHDKCCRDFAIPPPKPLTPQD